MKNLKGYGGVLLGMGLSLGLLHGPTWAQTFVEPDCSKEFDYQTRQATTTKRTLTLPQFGIRLAIPADYRALAMERGRVLIVDPGAYHTIKCQIPSGLFSTSLERHANPKGMSLQQFAAEKTDPQSFYPRRLQSRSFNDLTVVLVDYPGPDGMNNSGYSSHAFFQVPGSTDVVELSVGCDCPTNQDDLVEHLNNLSLL